MQPSFDVLYEDNHLLIVDKPAGLPTMGVPEGQPSLLAEAKAYIGWKYDKPGNVYLGVVSRLDAPVTGVLVIARTSKAAKRLTEQFKRRDVDKVYWACVEPEPIDDEAECVDWLRKDERHRRMHTTIEDAEGAQQAKLSYRRLAVRRCPQERAVLEVRLETGRKHQIRVQLAARRSPIVGDRKYGSKVSFPNGIALHSRLVRLEHPVKKTELEITAPLPESWGRIEEQ